MLNECCFPCRILTQEHNHWLCIKITACLENGRSKAGTCQHWQKSTISMKGLEDTITYSIKQNQTVNRSIEFTNNGLAKSLNLYATSKGFSFSTYSLFKPSITEVRAVKGIWACRVPNEMQNQWIGETQCCTSKAYWIQGPHVLYKVLQIDTLI